MKTMINWFMIPSTDFNRAVGFYEKIFGLKMVMDKDMEGCDVAFFFDPKEKAIGGGIGSGKNMLPGRDGPLIYLNADGKLDKVLSKVKEAGGKITSPKTSIGSWGNIAMIDDTEGNSVGLHAI